MRDRDRDAAAAGADVDDTDRAIHLARDGHRALNQHFGVWVRHQHVGRDLEVEAHELAVADEVRHRLAFCTLRDQTAVSAQLGLLETPVELQVQVEPAELQRVRKQELGVEARRVRAVLLEVVGGELQDLNDGQLAAAPPFSCAVRSAATKAFTRSSRSPAITRSSLCSVRLMRWSVTRFSLKL